ncbi:MAG TPA: hypothetical protein VFY65_15745 [Longimicrobium sp.]|nr:hypothetical protein [Longimicrobium sp.]
MTRLRPIAGWGAFLLLAVLTLGRLQRREPDTVWSSNGVRMEEVGLPGLVAAVPASDVAAGTCVVSHRQPAGLGFVKMSFPGAPDDILEATVMLDAAGAVRNYSELRKTADATTSVAIDVAQGTGGMTNVTEGGARVMIGRGTADEALRSEALGSPARRIETILARCGRPGEKSTQS